MNRKTMITLVCGLTIGLGGPALAQNALGDGQALDNSLAAGTRRNAARVDYRQELRFRNSIATGNAPGGLSFRGDVGYRAPGEFTGDLGSDTLFAYRRDSLYSGLAGMGIRGTEAVQYQFALTTGARLPQNLTGSFAVTRDGGAYGGAARTTGTGGLPDARLGAQTPAIGRIDMSASGAADAPDGGMGGMLRATSAYTANRTLQPFLLGAINMPESEERLGVTASSLRGVRLATLGGQEKTNDQRVDYRADTSFAAQSGEQRPGAIQMKPTAYDQVMADLRERAEAGRERFGIDAGADEPADTWWERELEDLTKRLNLPSEAFDAPGTTPDGQGDGVLDNLLGGDEGDEEDAESKPGRSERFNPKTIDILRDNSESMHSFIDPGASADDLYIAHMRAGERLLAGGRYFDAEERFTRALSAKPGDVTAQIGRVHAQLGAGLLMSAALNLRSGLMSHPEMGGTRFDAALLPEPSRTGDLVLLFRENIGVVQRKDGATLVDPGLMRDSGLLLAYLGYQTGDADAVAQGLGSFRASIEGDLAAGEPEPSDLRLVELLEKLWVEAPAGGR